MSQWRIRLMHSFWDSGLGLLGVLLLLTGIAVASLSEWRAERRDRPGRTVVATITSLGSQFNKFAPGKGISVVAQDVDGVVGRDVFDAGRVSGCRIGDNINAKRVGGELILEPLPCEQTSPHTPPR